MRKRRKWDVAISVDTLKTYGGCRNQGDLTSLTRFRLLPTSLKAPFPSRAVGPDLFCLSNLLLAVRHQMAQMPFLPR